MLDDLAPRRREDRIASALLVAFGLALVWPLRSYGLILNDEGWLFHPALRMIDGEILYRDIWVHYAPLRFHLVTGLFSVTGPSLLAARTLLGLMIVGNALGLFWIARRFASPIHALLPAIVYLLVPGPWYAAFYAFCTLVFFLALARALEAPSTGRFLWLGTAVGLALITRHELGLAQLGLAAVAVALRQPRAAGWVIGAAALPCTVALAYYAYHDALPGMSEALFVRAFGQLEGNNPAHVRRLFSPDTFGMAIEGRLAGGVLLTPLVVYPVFAVALLRRWMERRKTAEALFGAALLAYALATLPQSFTPPLIVRFLQAAAPFYLVVTWLGAMGGRASVFATGAAAAVLVWAVTVGLPRVDPTNAFTGSQRMRHEAAEVEVLGDIARTGWGTVEEIRLVRSFVEAHTDPGEPVFAAPWLSLYYVLLDRPNPTGYVFERMSLGDFAMSGGMKEAEMQALLASSTRYAIVLRRWWLRSEEGDAVLRTLHRHFAVVRDYRSLLILERDDDAALRELGEIYMRIRKRTARADDVAALGRLVESLPDEPLPAALLGGMLLETEPQRGITLLENALALDPANPEPLEWLARWHLRGGRTNAALRAIERATEVRSSPTLQKLRGALP